MGKTEELLAHSAVALQSSNDRIAELKSALNGAMTGTSNIQAERDRLLGLLREARTHIGGDAYRIHADIDAALTQTNGGRGPVVRTPDSKPGDAGSTPAAPDDKLVELRRALENIKQFSSNVVHSQTSPADKKLVLSIYTTADHALAEMR